MEGLNNVIRFIQENSPDGGFLQSEEWRRFQEAVGRKPYCIEDDNFYASIIEHQLPMIGRYFYVPHGPVITAQAGIQKNLLDSGSQAGMTSLINLAKKEKAGWIRIEPKNNKNLDIFRNTIETHRNKLRIIKAPHDVQPREILVIDITRPEEELLAKMKAKTRYNIKLSQKHNVFVKVISNFQFPISNKIPNSNDQNSKQAISYKLKAKSYIDKFIELVKITAKRDGITPHLESYYRKMFETIPSDILKLYVAEYQGKIISANIVIHYGDTAIYLHGASDNEHRNVMAPYLLQWQAILDAKKAGLVKYDMGGVKLTNNSQLTTHNWQGITRFKNGFAPNTKPIMFLGSYDIILKPFPYNLYRILQKIKNLL